MGKIYKSHHGWFFQINDLGFNSIFVKYLSIFNVKSTLNKPWNFIILLPLSVAMFIAFSLPLGSVLLSLYASLMAGWIGKKIYEKNVNKTLRHHVELIIASSDVVRSQPQASRVEKIATSWPHSLVTLTRFIPYFNHALSRIGDNRHIQLQYSGEFALHHAPRIAHEVVDVACDDRRLDALLSLHEHAASETRLLQEESTSLPSSRHVSRQLLQDVRNHNLRRALNTLQWALHQYDTRHALQHPFAMQVFKFMSLMPGMWLSQSASFEHPAPPLRRMLAIDAPSAHHEPHSLNHYSCARPLHFNIDGVSVMPSVSLPTRITSYLDPLLHHLFVQSQSLSSNHVDEAITRDEACSLLAICDEALEQPMLTGLQNAVHEEAHADVPQAVFEDVDDVIDEQAIDARFKATERREANLKKTTSQQLLEAIRVKRPVVSSTEPVNTNTPAVRTPKKMEVLSYASIVAKMRAELAAKNKVESTLKTTKTVQKNLHSPAKHATQQALAPKTFSQHLLRAAKQQKSTDMSSSGVHHSTEQGQLPAIDSRDPAVLSHAQTPAACSLPVSENIIHLTTGTQLVRTHIASQINTAYLPQFSFLAIDPTTMVADDKLEESNDELQKRLRDTVERYCAFLKGGMM